MLRPRGSAVCLVALLLLASNPRHAQAQANLAFYLYPGWSHVFVPRPADDATISSVPEPEVLYGNVGSTYVNIGVWNAGNRPTVTDFDAFLFVDATNFGSILWPPLDAYRRTFLLNVGPVLIKGGRHTFGAQLDYLGQVAETDETDNFWAHQWILTPLVLTPGSPVQRTAPPARYGGTDWINDGSPVYPNCDGLRADLASWWTAIPAYALENGDDYDLYLHTPSTGASDGFASFTTASAAGAGFLDFLVVNARVMGDSVWDVGVQNYNGGASQYVIEQVNNGSLPVNSVVPGSFAQGQVLALWELPLGPDDVHPVTLTASRRSPGTGPLSVAWLDRTFGVGGRYSATATAVTGSDGLAKLDVYPTGTGHYGVVLYRDPRDGLPAVDYAVRAQYTTANLRAWTLQHSGETFYLAELDPHRATFNMLGPLVDNLVNPELASDPLHDRLYVLSKPGMPPSLLTVSPSTLTVLNQVSLNMPGALYFTGLALDPLTGSLYTLAVVAGGEMIYTFPQRVDPATGALTTVGYTADFPAEPIAFSPRGLPHGLYHDSTMYQLVLKQLNLASLIGSDLGSTTSDVPDFWEDMAFLGNELWAINIGLFNKTAVRFDAWGQRAETVDLGTGQLYGLAMRGCVTASPRLIVRDMPYDSGGQMSLDWRTYPPPAGVVQYQVIRSIEPCQLADPDLPPVGAVLPPLQTYIDSGVQDFTAYYYGVRVITSGPVLHETLYAGPAVCFPNAIVNEFSTSVVPKRAALVQESVGAPSAGAGRAAGDGVPKVGEIVEIRNLSTSTLDLSGFRLSNGPGYPTPDEELLSGTVAAGGLHLHTLTTISLPAEGGTLSLLAPQTSSFAFDIVPYGGQGGAPAVPPGFTISRVEGTTQDDPVTSSFGAATSTYGLSNTVPPQDLGGSILMNEVVYTSTTGGGLHRAIQPAGQHDRPGRFRRERRRHVPHDASGGNAAGAGTADGAVARGGGLVHAGPAIGPDLRVQDHQRRDLPAHRSTRLGRRAGSWVRAQRRPAPLA